MTSSLTVRTTELSADDALLDLLRDDEPVTWLRRDEGLVRQAWRIESWPVTIGRALRSAPAA